MTDRRRSRAVHAQFAEPRGEDAGHEDNPFAPPPEGRPEQPWRPRHRPGPEQDPDEGGPGQDGARNGGGRPEPGWGSRWSSSQPGRQGGGFGRPGQQQGPGDRGDGPGPGGPRLRWDPTDPLQRHARYALHAGIWALFFVLIGIPEGAVLLGMPALYWGAHALRGRRKETTAGGRAGKARPEDVAGSERTQGAPSASATSSASGPLAAAAAERPAVSQEQADMTRKAAAVSGLAAAVLALALVVAGFAVHSVYHDYYTCRKDALTQASRTQCAHQYDAPWFTQARL